ncbi:MAG: DUF4372 domain-containing protein [Bacteroidetes bacterium]|nr:DUF4372 domain-containing protein [Bacteroidota bacterium]MBK6732021.1 DUF4372 domain-containing protein [Bacteroidota bacterium]
MLSLIPRSLIEKISKKHNANRYCKHFMSYDHLVTMLYSCFLMLAICEKLLRVFRHLV